MARFLALFGLLAALLSTPAMAGVTATFYSHNFRLMDGLNTDFPHGFVVLSGTNDAGEPVDLHLGFSAKNIFINVLWEPVEGALDDEQLTDAYVSDSIRHFAVPLTEAQYRAVLAVEHKWRTWPQPSYDMDTHNCVTFVKELAIASGLSVSESRKFIHAPKDFLRDTASRNAVLIAQLNGTAPATPVAAASVVPMPSLQQRVQQLQDAAAASKAGR